MSFMHLYEKAQDVLIAKYRRIYMVSSLLYKKRKIGILILTYIGMKKTERIHKKSGGYTEGGKCMNGRQWMFKVFLYQWIDYLFK